MNVYELLDRIIADAATAKGLLGPPVRLVSAHENLQSVLDSTEEGTIVNLQGNTFSGPFTMDRTLNLINGTLAAGSTWGLRVLAGSPTLDTTTIAGNANDLLYLPPSSGHTTVRNSVIRGDASVGAKRGIQANGNGLTVESSTITDIFRYGQESAGIGAWDSPGPFTIRNSVIQAAGMPFLFGGADPSSEARIPADILIEDSAFSKKPEWRGLGYACKNLGELKMGKRVVIRNNIFRYSWVEGQTGFGLVLSVRNQYGNTPWAIIEDVLISGNIIQDVGTAVSLLGRDYSYPSQVMRNITFRNNTFDNINKGVYGGRGATYEIHHGPDNLTIEGTVVQNSPLNLYSALFFAGEEPATNLAVRDNTFIEGSYGINGDGSLPATALGANTLATYAPGNVWENNTVRRSNIRNITWPAGTVLVG